MILRVPIECTAIKDLTALWLYSFIASSPPCYTSCMFKPATALLDGDTWAAMVQELSNASTSRRWHDFAWLGAHLMMIDPERARQLEVTDADWEGLIGELSRVEATSDWQNVAAWLAHLKKLDPARGAILVVPEDLWAAMLGVLETHRAAQSWAAFTIHAMHLHGADADRFRPALVTDADWDSIQGAIDAESAGANWDAVFRLSACLADIDSDRAKTRLQLQPTVWQNFSVELEASRQQKYWLGFATQLSRLVLLERAGLSAIGNAS